MNVGQNYTYFDFNNVEGIISTTSQDVGNSYEIGFLSHSKNSKKRLGYEFGVLFNEFNSIVKAPEDAIKYYTQFLGIKSALNYKILGNESSFFNVNLKGSISSNQLLIGNQETKGKIYDLKNFPELSKPIFMASLGLSIDLVASDNAFINIVYDRSSSFLNIGDISNQSLKLVANQFKVGIVINVNSTSKKGEVENNR